MSLGNILKRMKKFIPHGKATQNSVPVVSGWPPSEFLEPLFTEVLFLMGSQPNLALQFQEQNSL